MIRLSRAFLFATIALFPLGHPAWALKTTTASVACSSTTKLQAKIDAVPSGTIATFNVSGTCNENIVVPHGKTIVIKGVSLASKIIPKTLTSPTVLSNGDTTIQNMTIVNASGSAGTLVQVDRSASLDIIGSDLSAPNVGSVLGVWGGSAGRIFNSRIVGGSDDAVEVSDGSNLIVVGSPEFAAGPVGAKVVLSSPNSVALSCNDGGSLAMRSRGSTGAIEINNSKVGIYVSQCHADIVNKTSVADNFKITGIAEDGSAVNIQEGGNTRLKNISISNNSGSGLAIYNAGLANIYNSVFSGNAQSDISLGYGAIASIPGWPGASSLNDAFNANKIDCFQSADVPSAKLVVDSNGGLAVPEGKALSDLTDNNPGCIALY
jgi:hypothetical protein